MLTWNIGKSIRFLSQGESAGVNTKTANHMATFTKL